MREDHEAIHAAIRDDGAGFDVDSVMKNPYPERGLGLVGMTERALLLNGTLDITSEPGQGTLIKLHLPFQSSVSTESNEEVESYAE